ncbi:MAG: hypothetical protein LBG72_03805 [Spirochaetaceae bacterium]|jgi:hypothetical protein|nr:hypothetical protein [Spirochaetaceae bacterium]
MLKDLPAPGLAPVEFSIPRIKSEIATLERFAEAPVIRRFVIALYSALIYKVQTLMTQNAPNFHSRIRDYAKAYSLVQHGLFMLTRFWLNVNTLIH